MDDFGTMTANTEPPIRPYEPRDEAAVILIVEEGAAAQQEKATKLKLTEQGLAGMVDTSGAKSKDAMKTRPGDCFVAELQRSS
jgi:hypothetical protein